MTDWNGELNDLVATAKTPEELQALKAFQAAIGPYLQNPDLLRTLLSKIAAGPGGGEALHIVGGGKEFKSIEDLKAVVPEGVKVTASL